MRLLKGVLGCDETDNLSGSIGSSTPFTHIADCVFEYTLDTNDLTNVVFRSQDTTNNWIVKTLANTNMALREQVAGSFFERIILMGVATGGTRIGVKANGTTIELWIDDVYQSNYTSATNFQYETEGLVLNGDLSDLTVWPLCGAAIIF